MRALAALVAILPAPAIAQAYQCTLPRSVAPVPAATPDGPARRVAVGGYTLAVSWSPEFCRGAGRAGRGGAMQCDRSHGRFGFVLHGLWPEAARGPAPQWCRAVPPPPPATLRANLCMTPSPTLLAHEWAKHGSCMTGRPEGYFKVAGILWRSLHWPDADALSRRKDLTAGDLRAEFVALNRGWREDEVAVIAGRTGWLREVRLCYDAGFHPVRCPAARRGLRSDARLRIWRGLAPGR